MASMSDLVCWHCDAAEPEEDIRLLAVLRPRSAARGGPATLYRCLTCGVDNLLERNPAGEICLSPPTVARVSSPTLKGAVIASARRWVAENGAEREEFLARTVGRMRRMPVKEKAAPTPPEPAPSPEPPPEKPSLPDIEVSGIIDAYEVLGVPLTANQAELSKRYRELARKCHPDRVADLDEDIRTVADRKFRRLTKAYEIIMAQFE